MNTFEIKIVKCSSPFWWYVDHVGETFTVYHNGGENYIVYQDGWRRIGIAVFDACVL